MSTSPAKAIYDFLIKEVTHRNGSLIPSRNEKKSANIKWGVAFKNFKLVKGLNADEKCFIWKITGGDSYSQKKCRAQMSETFSK